MAVSTRTHFPCLRTVVATVVWTLVFMPSSWAAHQGFPSENKTGQVQFCRDSWIQNLTVAEFKVLTCSKCHIQVLLGRAVLTFPDTPWPPAPPYALVHQYTNRTYLPDPDRYPSAVCEAALLDKADCERWRSCCQAARRCCEMMGSEEEAVNSSRCPATWDGMVCWASTPPNTTMRQHCPYYYQIPGIAWHSPQARRACTSDGTWFPHPSLPGSGYTDFTSCHDTSYNQYILRISLYVDLVGNGISVFSLILSIIIIFGFRSLRRELLGKDSLKLHLNLFVAMILTGIFSLSFHYIIFDNQIIKTNPIWCRCLNAFTKYFRSVTYIAMFAEGLYLHRRISRVLYLSRREPLLKYFIMSWLAPAVSVLAYIITRVSRGLHEGCWMRPEVQWLELIHMVPNIISLACNIVFLISIEVNLCTKMRTDSSDRRVDVLRHALRATLSLIPVFGLQFLFLAYRPVNWPPYEIIASLVISTQGFLVAVLYCLSTKEVRNELLLFCKRWCVCPCAGFRRSFFDDHRRVGTDSNLKDRCLDMQGYMYMCQRSARNSLSFQGRRSLPDVIDSVCMSKTTRTTSLGSNLQEREYRLSLHSNRLSTDITHLHPDFPQGRRLSTKSLPVQCTCNPKQAGSCACANGVLRNNLAPLLRLSPEHSSTSGGLTGTDATLFEEPEIQAQSKQETNSDVAL